MRPVVAADWAKMGEPNGMTYARRVARDLVVRVVFGSPIRKEDLALARRAYRASTGLDTVDLGILIELGTFLILEEST